MVKKSKLKFDKLRLKSLKYCRRCGQRLSLDELRRSQFVCNKCMFEQLYKLKD